MRYTSRQVDQAARAYYGWVTRNDEDALTWEQLSEGAQAPSYEVAQVMLGAAMEIPWPTARPGIPMVVHE